MYDNGIFVVILLTFTFCKHRPVRNIWQPVIPLTDCGNTEFEPGANFVLFATFIVKMRKSLSEKANFNGYKQVASFVESNSNVMRPML